MRFDRLLFAVALGLSAFLTPAAFGQAPPPPVPPAPPAPPANAITLNGKVSGPYTVTQANPDTGKAYSLGGSGTVDPLRTVNVNGSFQTPGNIANGHAEGTITLSGPQGGVTVKLVGPPSAAFGPPPASFDYSITAGTGNFNGATGAGKAAFTLDDPSLAPGKSPGPVSNYSLTFGTGVTQDGFIKVEFKGLLRQGIVAPGGETTGTTITESNVTWELDLHGDPALLAKANELNGKTAVAHGTLVVRKDIIVPLRFIVTVSRLNGPE